MITLKQQQQLINLLCSTGNEKVYVGKKTAELLSNIGIYPFLRGRYRLREDDKNLVRTYVRKHYGVDLDKPISKDAKNRFEQAKVIPDEKRGNFSVFGSMLNFSGNSKLYFKDGTAIELNPNAVVSCELDKLDSGKISSLIIVENGTNIIRSSEMIELLPYNLRESLILFRGHKKNVVHVKSLVSLLNADCAIYYFYDYDPCGLYMMIQEGLKRKASLILPESLNSEVIRLNKHRCFKEQFSYMESLYEKRIEFSSALRKHIEIMKDKEYAITQENIIAHGQKLTVIPLKNE